MMKFKLFGNVLKLSQYLLWITSSQIETTGQTEEKIEK